MKCSIVLSKQEQRKFIPSVKDMVGASDTSPIPMDYIGKSGTRLSNI